MDLHVRASIVIVLGRRLHPLGHHLSVQQVKIELLRRDTADDRPPSLDDRVLHGYAGSTAVCDDYPVHVRVCFEPSSAILNESHERFGELRAASTRDRHTAKL